MKFTFRIFSKLFSFSFTADNVGVKVLNDISFESTHQNSLPRIHVLLSKVSTTVGKTIVNSFYLCFYI